MIRTYEQFVRAVAESDLTVAELRGDVRPTPAVETLWDRCGDLERYERFVLRYQNAGAA